MKKYSALLLVVVTLIIGAAIIIANLPENSRWADTWVGGLQDTFSDFADDGDPVESLTDVDIARPSEATLSHVAYVHDGDTLYLQPDGTSARNDQIKVRLIGIDTPELRPEPECFGFEARDYLRSVLPEGTEVWIMPDREPVDQYGRSLLYLWTTDERSVNLDLVKNGYASALNIAPSNTYWQQFDAAESEAQRAGVGLWGFC